MNTIHNLRKMGIKTRVTHYRFVEMIADNGRLYITRVLLPMHEIRESEMQNRILPKGGKTVLELTNGNQTVILESKCSDLDLYNCKVGVKLALEKKERWVSFLS